MVGISFSISCFIFLLILSFAYFSKEKIKNIDNKLFSIILVLNLIGIIIDVSGFIFFRMFGTDSIFNICVSKIYLIYYISYTFCLMIYAYNLSYKKLKNLLKFILIFSIACISILMLPIDLYFDGLTGYSSGPSVNLAYVVAFINMGLMMVCLFHGRKNMKKQYIPLFSFLILTVVVLAVQKINPEITLLLFSNSIVTFLMYLTIENPDMKLIEQLNIAKDQADKANRAKTEFLSSMSHEIRTPLNAIVGFSNTLSENPKLPEDVKEDVKDILTASDNLLEIVNGVLDISKIEANKIEIINNEYDTKKMFDELTKLTKVRIGEKPIDFTVKIDESIPRVLYGDHIRVKQVILNLLTNAAKYTDSGKIDFKVNSVKKDNVIRLIVSVEDTGRGIKEENIDKLFTKFERLDEERNTTIEGTGLGLAITKKLVDMMNGKIVVQSKFGKGSKFTVSIDQKIVKKPTIVLDETTVIMESLNLKGKRVLVVDDNKLNIKVASKLLEAYNVDITTLLSGEETLSLLKKDNKFDIILLDDMMPKLSGTETFKKIKEDKLYDGPIVCLTANALTGEKEKYLELGFDDYLAKPIEKIELNRVLKKYLKK